MKRLISVLFSFLLIGCTQTKIDSPQNSPIPSNETVITTIAPTPSLPLDDSLPLASIGIFTDINDPNVFCIVSANVYRNDKEYNSIDLQPLYDFNDSHKELIEYINYHGTYDDSDGTMLKTMGFTPQSLDGYSIEYYYHYYKVDSSIINEFKNTIHTVQAKYGTRIQEGEEIPIHFIEESIEFKTYMQHNMEVNPLPIAYNKDGYNYYLVNEAENLYMKIKDDINEVFTVGHIGMLYGVFYKGIPYDKCLWGNIISTSAYTGHGESGGFSTNSQQLSKNLRIDPFMNIAMPHIEDSQILDAVTNFDYTSVSLEIVQ